MWRPFNSRSIDVVAALLIATSLVSCSKGTSYRLGDPISMGPWTFEVESVREQIESHTSFRVKIVELTFQLQNYRERHEKTFDDFLNGSGERRGMLASMFVDPHFWLVDEEGNRFLALLSPVSGGSLRSERWRVRFELVNGKPSEDAALQAARYLNRDLADFRLVIENPNHRKGQPRKIVVALR